MKLSTQRRRITDQFQNCSLALYIPKGFAFKAGCDTPGPRGTIEERDNETGRAAVFGPGVKSLSQFMLCLLKISRSKLPLSGSQNTPVKCDEGKSFPNSQRKMIPCRSLALSLSPLAPTSQSNSSS